MSNEVEVTSEELETFGAPEVPEVLVETLAEPGTELPLAEAVEENGPVEEPADVEAESEEAPASATEAVRANRRLTRKQTAHVPGPRRKPTLDPTASQWGAEEESGAEAPAEAEDSDEGDAFE